MTTSHGPAFVHFADCALDLQSGELIRAGKRQVLPDQPFRILRILTSRPGTLVTREELQRELWPDGTFVDYEHSLNAAVKRLRELLDDSASTPVFIETVPRRGYRFVTTVTADAPQVSAAPPAPVAADPNPAAVSLPAVPPFRADRPSSIFAFAGVLGLVVLVSLAWAWFGSRSTEMPNSITPVRLTSTSGVNAEPALSPDGSMVAFASDRAGRGDSDIWVQRVGGSTQVRLTSDEADESEPSFSHDGTEVVYSHRKVGLYVIGALGGDRRLVAQSPWARTPKFSPDGRWIAYWTGFPASVVAGGIPGALGSIYLVPATGGTPVLLQTSLSSARYPIWSVDGSRILFLGEEDSDQKAFDWYVVDRDGGRAVKTGALTAMRSAGLNTQFPIPGAWTPSANAVVFASNEIDTSNLWKISISPETGLVSGPAEALTRGTAIERQPTVSDNGRIVFASATENVDIWRLPVDSRTGLATGPAERLTQDAANDRLRNVTADGQLVFISSRTGRDEVWVKDLRSGREHQVTHEGIDDASGSADGRKVAYATSRGAAPRVDLIDVKTDAGVPSSVCVDCYGPSDWSADNTRLVVSQGRRPARLKVYELASHRLVDLVAHPTWSAGLARFSQDGDWLAFHTANSPNVRQVYAVPARLGRPALLRDWVPIVVDHGCHPSWSGDGSLVFHFSFRDGAFCPWVQRVNAATKQPMGQPSVVHHFHEARLRAASGTAAFNDVQGGYLYLSLTETTSQIWALESVSGGALAGRLR